MKKGYKSQSGVDPKSAAFAGTKRGKSGNKAAGNNQTKADPRSKSMKSGGKSAY